MIYRICCVKIDLGSLNLKCKQYDANNVNVELCRLMSNLEFTFEVGGSLVAADVMFLEPSLMVI